MADVALTCAGCGTAVALDERFPFRCRARREGDDIDHVVREVVTPSAPTPGVFAAGDVNPFVRYRDFAYSHAAALAWGLSDQEYVAIVRRLDEEIARVDGHGFVETPLVTQNELARALDLPTGSTLLVKDETQNVSGSHKGRHLMGIMIWLEVVRRTFPRRDHAGDGALEDGRVGAHDEALAIASCGNAALAAAVIARAAGRPLDVFVPPHATAGVKARLEALGAHLVLCPRQGDQPGDPCYLSFRGAVDRGELPFTCQGNENGLTISGGKTLGYELVSQLADRPIDRLFIQVGGAALASACIQALRDAVALGQLERMPAIHAVQTEGGYPLVRAYRKLTERLGDRPSAAEVRAAIAYAAHHRAEFMWPWETEPHSVAEGILDDETYDWLAVLEGIFDSGGSALTVSEAELHEAHRLAHAHTRIGVCPTGSAGLAGLLHQSRAGLLGPDERIAALFTGHTRN